MRKICFFTIVTLGMLMIFQSCSNNDTEKFLGTWRNTKKIHQILIITKSDKNFFVEAQSMGDLGDIQIPASYDDKNDKLTLSIAGGNYDIVIMPDKQKLLFATEEFVKQ